MNIEIQVTDYVINGKFTVNREMPSEIDDLIDVLLAYQDSYCEDDVEDTCYPSMVNKKCSIYKLWYDKIQTAILIEKDVCIEYKDVEGDITLRKISPLTIYGIEEDARILAFCYLREDHRVFKLNRILGVYTTDYDL